MAYELSSAYTKVDPSSYLSSGTNSFTCTSMPGNVAAEWYKDFGASYFSSNYYFESQFVFTTSTASGGGTNQAYVDISFSDTQTQAPSFVNALWLEFYCQASGTYTFRLNSYLSSVLGTSVVGTGAGLTVGTTYYIRVAFVDYLGQYGGFFAQIFSDSGFTTLVDGKVWYAPSAVPALRYYNAIASNNTTATKLATATHQNITMLTCSAGGFNLTTATYFLSGSASSYTNYSSDASRFTLSTQSTSNGLYAYYDYTAGYMNANYTIQGAIANYGGASSLSNTLIGSLFSVSNTLNNSNTTNDWQGVDFYWDATTANYKICVREVSGGTGYSSSFLTGLPAGTNAAPFFLKFWRDTAVGTYGTIYAAAYSDPTYTYQIGSTISQTLHGSVNFRYALLASANNYSGTARSSSFYMGGVTITIPPPPVTISAGKGPFSWAGKTSTLAAQAISSQVGAFSWGGTPATITQMIQSSRGTFTWAGKFSSVSTGNSISSRKGAFAWAGKSSPLTINVTAKIGGWGWVGKTSILGAAVTSLRTWEITKWDTATNKEIPVTGLTNVLYMLYDPNTRYVLDFSDNTFKQSNLCTSPQGTMTERILLDSHGNNMTPGVYDILLSTTTLSGLYQEFGVYYGTNNYFNSNPVRFQDGVEYLGGLTVTENTKLLAIPSNPVLTTDPRMDLMKYKHVLNIDGTVKLYDGSNNLAYQGLAYMDAAMTKLYDGTAPVVATTWLT